MSIRKIDLDAGFGCLFEIGGSIEDADVVTHIHPHLNDRSDHGLAYRYTLINVSTIAHFGVATDAIRQTARLAVEACRVNPEAIAAFILPQDAAFGLYRLFESNMGDETWETKAFAKRALAETWVRELAAERFGRDDLRFE